MSDTLQKMKAEIERNLQQYLDEKTVRIDHYRRQFEG